jgi:hypothetical protein
MWSHSAPLFSCDLRLIYCPQIPEAIGVVLRVSASGGTPNVYFPALCHSLVSHDAFLSFKRIHAPVYIATPALDAG